MRVGSPAEVQKTESGEDLDHDTRQDIRQDSPAFPGEVDSSTRLREAVAQVTPQLRRVLSRYSIPPEDGEDLLQDSVLVLLERFERAGEAVHEPAGYLIGVLRRRCLMYWRQKRSRSEFSLEELEEPSERPGQRRVEHRQELSLLLSSLKEGQKRLLMLRLYFGYSSGEVADSLGIAKSTVRKGMHRTRLKLRAREERKSSP